MFLMKLKLGLSFRSLATIFNVSDKNCSQNFKKALRKIGGLNPILIKWLRRDQVLKSMPDYFKENYSNTRIIVDCLEIFVQPPIEQSEQGDFWSRHQRRHTVKFIIGIAPTGYITFISKIYPGSASYVDIFIESNLVDKLEKGDKIMTDKDFSEAKLENEIITAIPPRVKRIPAQFSKEQLETCRKNALVRIQAKQATKRIKTFKILNNEIPRSLIPFLPNIITVCAMAVNLGKPIDPSSSISGIFGESKSDVQDDNDDVESEEVDDDVEATLETEDVEMENDE